MFHLTFRTTLRPVQSSLLYRWGNGVSESFRVTCSRTRSRWPQMQCCSYAFVSSDESPHRQPDTPSWQLVLSISTAVRCILQTETCQAWWAEPEWYIHEGVQVRLRLTSYGPSVLLHLQSILQRSLMKLIYLTLTTRRKHSELRMFWSHRPRTPCQDYHFLWAV